MAERWEEEEGEEGARRWSSGGSYRPRGSWTREVATGGGQFGPGRLDGGLAGERAALRMAGVAWRLGEASGTRVRVRRCQEAARWRWGTPRVHLAAGARWTKSTGGVRRAARNRATGGERDEGEGLFVISENPGTYR